jgi:hypothetical protein
MNVDAILNMLNTLGSATKISAPDNSYRITTVGVYSTTDTAAVQSNGNAVNLAQPAGIQVDSGRVMYVAATKRAPLPNDIVTIGQSKRRVKEVIAYSLRGKDVAYKLRVT